MSKVTNVNGDKKAKELPELWEHSYASAYYTISNLRVEMREKHPNSHLPDIEATAVAIANQTVQCYTDRNLDSIEIYKCAWEHTHFLLWGKWQEGQDRDPAQPLPWMPPIDETIQAIAVQTVNHQSYITGSPANAGIDLFW